MVVTESLLGIKKLICFFSSVMLKTCEDCKTHELRHDSLMHIYYNKKDLASSALFNLKYSSVISFEYSSIQNAQSAHHYCRAGLSSWHCVCFFSRETVTLSAWLTSDIAAWRVAVATKVLMRYKIRVCGQMRRGRQVQWRVIQYTTLTCFCFFMHASLGLWGSAVYRAHLYCC